MLKKSIAFALAALLIFGASITSAQQSTGSESTIPFQGKLTSATGTALTGSYDFRFSLFTDATVGESLWTSDHA
ncbi:MAG: hypothetical protein NUW37_04285, partial [Planctomycetes bacterium]|nr:hypothetical protein [Planctomycetota bacterium]